MVEIDLIGRGNLEIVEADVLALRTHFLLPDTVSHKC